MNNKAAAKKDMEHGPGELHANAASASNMLCLLQKKKMCPAMLGLTHYKSETFHTWHKLACNIAKGQAATNFHKIQSHYCLI